MPTIAIIGAGFSGTLLALHLLRRSGAGTNIKLIEREPPFGPGLAFGTSNPSHTLNVRAGGMSAYRDMPNHFLEWLNLAPHRCGQPRAGAGVFVPRQEFGAYIKAQLEAALKECLGTGRINLLHADVTGLELPASKPILKLRDGSEIAADLVVLATGNPPPSADPAMEDLRCYRVNPWAPDALSDLDPMAQVMLIGTGLTAVDVIMSLLDRGHQGSIHALSRRGLLPHRHLPVPIRPVARAGFAVSPIELLRTLRQEARIAMTQGSDWRPVIDSIRPFTSDIWQLMSMSERGRFLRHLRPWWDIHRHRMAPAIADRIDAARASGQLQISAGRIKRIARFGETAEITYRPRGQQTEVTKSAQRIINCTGPANNYARIADPLVRGLINQGIARPDPLRLGLDVTANCALRSKQGEVSRNLFAIGTLSKGTFWEMVAVPDIRRQCEVLAGHLAGLLLALDAEGAEGPAADMFVI